MSTRTVDFSVEEIADFSRTQVRLICTCDSHEDAEHVANVLAFPAKAADMTAAWRALAAIYSPHFPGSELVAGVLTMCAEQLDSLLSFPAPESHPDTGRRWVQ